MLSRPSFRAAHALVPGRPAAHFESLEARRLLHGGGHGDGGGDDGGHGDDGHGGTGHLDPEIVAEVRASVLAGRDVSKYIGTDYDPHVIGVPTDDPRLDFPIAMPVGALVNPALPDMLPWAGPSGRDYFHDTQVDTFTLPGRKLLRFSTAIANGGAGPVELRAGQANPDGTQQVNQRIYSYNPATNQFSVVGDRLAGNFVYHETHNHLHFEGYAEYRLLTNDNGVAGGPATRSDGTEVEGEKVGFCLINVTTYDSSLPGYNSSPSGYGCGNLQGISVGRADVYWSGLDNQWIDVTGVEAGTYFLEVTLDVGDAIMESNESNNTIRVPVTIGSGGAGGGGIQPDRFDSIALNNTFETATDFGELGDRIETSMTIHADYDADFYKFVATSSMPVTIQMPFTGGNPDLFLYDGDQNEIARSTRPSGMETVTADLTAGETYYIRVSVFQSLDNLVQSYALLIDGPLPTASLELSQPVVVEGRTTTFDVHRNGPITTSLIVPIEFDGTAIRGIDYTVDMDVASFGAEARTVTVTLTALTDRILEGSETVEITLASSSAYVASNEPAVLTIRDPLLPRGGGIRPHGLGGYQPITAAPIFGRNNLSNVSLSPFADTVIDDDSLFGRLTAGDRR